MQFRTLLAVAVLGAQGLSAMPGRLPHSSTSSLASEPSMVAPKQSAPTIDINNSTNIANGTVPDVLQSFRAEIGTKLCRHEYYFTHEEWILQIPTEWWKDKYSGDAMWACKAWARALESQRMCGFRFNECWEMDQQWPSGKPGWLHARAQSCIGPNESFFENGFTLAFDFGSGGFHDTDCRYGWNR